MKKLALRLEDLRIDSFSTTSLHREQGTVFGEQCTCYTNCTCPGCPTCDGSCGGTCDRSCYGTCDATCDRSCYGGCETDPGGASCNYTCGGYATYADINQHCILC